MIRPFLLLVMPMLVGVGVWFAHRRLSVRLALVVGPALAAATAFFVSRWFVRHDLESIVHERPLCGLYLMSNMLFPFMMAGFHGLSAATACGVLARYYNRAESRRLGVPG